MGVWHSACNDKAHKDERVRVEYEYNVTDGHMRASESVLHSPCNDKAHKDERVRVVACRCRGGARRESEIESERRSEKTRMKRERRAKCIRRGKGDKEEKGKRQERETNCYILPSCRRGSVLRDFLCREVCVSCSEGAGGGQGWIVGSGWKCVLDGVLDEDVLECSGCSMFRNVLDVRVVGMFGMFDT